MRTVGGDAFGVEKTSWSFARRFLSNNPMTARHASQDRRAQRPLQINDRVIGNSLELVAQGLDFVSCFPRQGMMAPIFGRRKIEAVDNWLFRSPAGALIGGEQCPPSWLDDPVNLPCWMREAQRRDRRQGMQNVAHGAWPDHKEAEL